LLPEGIFRILTFSEKRKNEMILESLINLSLVPLSCTGIFAIYWLIAVLKNYII
jgi:hypothetical protein